MKISLITVSWNCQGTIADAMRSVLRQQVLGFELEYIVVDGGSTDGTVEAIKCVAEEVQQREDGFSFKWISEPDRGMYDAINKGIRMATGDVVGILNADDILAAEDTLARMAQEFESADASLQCLYGNVIFVKGDIDANTADRVSAIRALKTHRICFARFWRPWMLQWGYMPPHPAIFIRRECFLNWGGYEPDKKEYRIAADYELLIRYFRCHKMKSRYVRLVTTIMRLGGLSTKDAGARKKLNDEIIKGNRVNGYFCVWPMLLPKYFIKIWEFILPRL